MVAHLSSEASANRVDVSRPRRSLDFIRPLLFHPFDSLDHRFG